MGASIPPLVPVPSIGKPVKGDCQSCGAPRDGGDDCEFCGRVFVKRSKAASGRLVKDWGPYPQPAEPEARF